MDTREALKRSDEISEKRLLQLRRRNAELEILYDTIQDLTSTLSVNQVLDRILDRTLGHLDAEIGSIMLRGPDSRLRVVAARGLPQEVVEATAMEPGEGISGHVVSSGRSLIIEDVEADPRFARRNHERYYTRSLICSALRRADTVLGVVNVNNKRSQEPFVPEDLRLLDGIAAHAAVALGNAHQYEETLRRAQHDALTGLANHGHLFSMLELEIARADRYGRDLALAIIDIDHFKAYNDRHGHRAGDEALIRVANTIADLSRSHDVVARYGGEEFVAVLPETRLDGAVAFGEKIRQGVESTSFGPNGRHELTVSVGVAVLPRGGTAATTLVEAADAQLYRAKAEGRNRVCSAEPDAT
ncbi:MAG: sensor domain-containing diguanylate cyclase [Deltaproteobacteria bacterium]|nr:MAG: sensor domain-containing diguanylate cyclase [Deltaproteobacteria bacterium]